MQINRLTTPADDSAPLTHGNAEFVNFLCKLAPVTLVAVINDLDAYGAPTINDLPEDEIITTANERAAAAMMLSEKLDLNAAEHVAANGEQSAH